MRSLRGEGFRHIYKLDSQEAVDGAEAVRQRLWTDRRDERGPFDIIGDVHGCADELEALLGRLGYGIEPVERDGEASWRVDAARRPQGGVRGRSRRSRPTCRGHAAAGHDHGRGWRGAVRAGQPRGQARPLAAGPRGQADPWPRSQRARSSVQRPKNSATGPQVHRRLVSHYMLDDGRLAVAHAGLKEEMQGRASGAIRSFCMYGETTGEVDAFGLPVRLNWAMAYRGDTKVVFGHTPMLEPAWLNNTLCIDTGCVFGGRLTALRYPELELAAVPAARVYQEPARPMARRGGRRGQCAAGGRRVARSRRRVGQAHPQYPAHPVGDDP